MKTRSIPAGRFKAECLRLMDEVAAKGKPIVITKRGKPVAQLVPAETARPVVAGKFRGRIKISGDIVKPALAPEEWGELWS